MKIPYLSTTLIKNFPICGVRALHAHSIRIEDGDGDWGSNPTRFGTIVHNVAEEMHKLDMAGKAADPMDLYDEIWRKSNLFDLRYYSFGRETIAEFIDRTLFNRNGETIATEFPFLLDVVSGEVWDLTGIPQPKVLKMCAAVVKKKGVPVISKIDRIDQIDEDSYEVYDYKTNLQPFTRDEVDNSEQLAIYHMAVKGLHDAKNIKCIFDMLRHGRFATVFDEERLVAIRGFIINLWHQIAATEEPVPELNKYCSWCEVKENCPVYAAALMGDLTHPYAPGDEATPEELWKHYSDLKTVVKLAEQRADQFGQVIMALIVDQNEGHPVELEDGRELYLQQNPRYEYYVDDVFAVFKKHDALSLLKQCANISKPKLENAIRGRVKLQNEINPLLSKTFAKPTIKARKKGAKEETDETAG